MPSTVKEKKKVTAFTFKIREAQRAYDVGTPLVTDEVFDAWVAEVRRLDPNAAVLKELGQPTSAMTLVHLSPMLSLSKEYEINKVVTWGGRTGGGPFIVQPKIDGVALSIRYANQLRQKAATRGDGRAGDCISLANLSALNVPTRMPYMPKHNTDLRYYEVRGEVVMPRATFDAKYAKDYANPRNLIAGALSSSDGAAVLTDATFLAYGIVSKEGPIASLTKCNTLLDEHAFVVPLTREADDIDDLRDTLEELMAVNNLPYEIDGWVVKCDLTSDHARLGATAHHPRWAVALKLQGDSSTSIVQNVTWEASRTGTLTPVVVMDPVKLSGASVTRATLHHAALFDELQLRHGSEIIVTRRGGVIPHVEGVKSAGGGPLFKAPHICPTCHQKTLMDGLFLICPARACKAKRAGAIEHWFKVVGALGLGSVIIDRCFDTGLTEIVDYYKADVIDLRMAGLGEKVAKKLLAEIERTRTMDEVTFITALGIEGVGRSTADRIVKAVPGGTRAAVILPMNDVMPHLERVVGGRAAAVYLELANASGLFMEINVGKVGEPSNGPMAGMKVVFTGSLSDTDRETARAQARELGAETPANVTREVTHLVVGDGARDAQTGKRDKAAKLNAKGAKIKILSETEWVLLLANAQPE